MSRKNKKIIAITIGDPGGIGPEIILKSFHRLRRHLTAKKRANLFFVCIGSFAVLSKWKKKLKSRVRLHVMEKDFNAVRLESSALNVFDISGGKGQFSVGKVSRANGKLALDAIRCAGILARDKKVDAVVTAPVQKSACQRVERNFLGHTELFAKIDRSQNYAMMLSGGGLRVILETVHIPISKVSRSISKKSIYQKIVLAHHFGRRHLGLKRPRIGVAGLNPHAGEAGSIGEEDQRIITPAIKQAFKKKICVSGPHPADTIFYKAYHGTFDFVIAMYHDQGLGPLKMIALDLGVNTTMGLSFVRTSPDHGTAFDIVGKNKANPSSMTNAILTAVALVSRH